MLMTEYKVLNDLQKKLEQSYTDQISLILSLDVENSHALAERKGVLKFVVELQNDLQEYAQSLNDPNYDETKLQNFFGQGD